MPEVSATADNGVVDGSDAADNAATGGVRASDGQADNAATAGVGGNSGPADNAATGGVGASDGQAGAVSPVVVAVAAWAGIDSRTLRAVQL